MDRICCESLTQMDQCEYFQLNRVTSMQLFFIWSLLKYLKTAFFTLAVISGTIIYRSESMVSIHGRRSEQARPSIFTSPEWSLANHICKQPIFHRVKGIRRALETSKWKEIVGCQDSWSGSWYSLEPILYNENAAPVCPSMQIHLDYEHFAFGFLYLSVILIVVILAV